MREALRTQGRACADLGSPFMARLMAMLAERLMPDRPLTRRLFGWPGALGPSDQSVPLRLAGALHALVLQGHPGLAAVYPPHAVDDQTLWSAIDAALTRDAASLDAFLDNPPQTNEVRRSAVLIATGHWLAARYPLPFVFSELGASAGLNLNWDRFALEIGPRRLGPARPVLTLTPDWRGAAPPAATVTVAERAGVDLAPLAVTDPADRLRLLAYLWPDQPQRRALTEAAIAAAPPCPVRADAIDWLEPRLAPRPGQLHLIWSTVAWQYFPAATQARGRALIEAAGRHATDTAPLAWLSYEADGASPGAGVTLRLWPGDRSIVLGRADFHGRWVDWTAP
ncbi:MAG: DUF2332 family protein [Rhodobacteraceae bacterium]|nr:DUF2332 family protein [Paracoccaceae bacterium]